MKFFIINSSKQSNFMRKSFVMLVLFCIGICTNVLWAQKTVSGVVMEKEVNMPLIGCNVVEKGTTNGTVTDLDGKYTLMVGDNATIEFSYIGMTTIEEVVGDRSVINVDMISDSEKIEEVVVTAMGIQRKAKSLTYATQQVSNQELTRAKDANMINALQGKTAGLVITPNSSGAGGSSKLVFDHGQRIERVENVKDVSNYISRIDEMIERKRTAIATWL